MILVPADVTAIQFNPAPASRLAGDGHLAKPDRRALGHAPVSPKRRLVSVECDPAQVRLNGHRRFRLRPLRALIDPAAHQRDLRAAQRRGLSLRRHLHVLHQPGDVMHQWAPSALAGIHRDTDFSAPHRRLATGHLILAFGPLIAVALDAGAIKNRLNFGGKIDAPINRLRQPADIHGVLSEPGRRTKQDGRQESH